jgi:hypothetical protein
VSDQNNKSRTERFAVWLASTRFGQAVFASQKKIIMFFFTFMLFTHALYWATAWYTPWIYILFMVAGVWFGQGVFSQFSIIIRQSMEKEWDPILLKMAIPFILVNWAALFACLYMTFGVLKYSDGTSVEGMWDHFYFSVVTLTTLGYGNIVPCNFAAELLAVIESLIGFMGFAVLAGIIASIAFKRAEFNE